MNGAAQAILAGAAASALLAATAAPAAAAAAEEPGFPQVIPAPSGAVILPTPRDRDAYMEDHYAAVRRVGDMLYLSGVIIGRRDGEGNDMAAFKLQSRRGLDRLKRALAAAGASFDDVVLINSFHVWKSDNFAGSRDEQFAAFSEVVGEYAKGPYPAWTAVGTTGLLADGGIVEVQLIAKVPAKVRR